ncbi:MULTISPECIES: YihY/virulence factor BrkB family protein [Micromonospora]|uniref:YihY/virulence factor BrkB family protein n=1 Tax=Micromonospora TaxID=1873 RepID=UPI001B38F0E9|nr:MULTISPECIES: YihY/virulence factor BrkB family protein [unclassified Micromonospora]MBQ0977043.1 YihY/virulence factor BrkB family protein [Micromonospora sp. M61]MBQ1037790.1 YihY/virulence factor BrkB family protein [Micromonospora sp. C81]WTI24302.1 YihY/virulence factor BrkB family protein [Micromonospora zamorensis]
MTTTEPGTTREGAHGTRVPRRMRQLSWRTWRGVLVRSVQNFVNDNCSDWAAALTYYGVLAVFPSAIVIVALVGLVSSGEQTVDTIVELAGQVGAGSVLSDDEDGVVGVIRTVVLDQSNPKLLLSFGLLGALWSASGFIGAFTRASNAIYGVDEGRPVWKLRPLQIGLAAITLVLLAVVALGLIVSGPVTDAVGDLINAGGLARTVWSVAKWPVLAMIMMSLLSLLFWIAPNVRQPRFRWLTPGGAVALVSWAVASFGFGLYVTNFSSYDTTYGSLGAAIAFLVWLYLSNSALMLGVQINAEVQRGRQLQAGDQDPEEPVLPPRKPADD